MPLYLVATPIGNLADMTFRAVQTLRSSDLILCEDTRTSQVLLRHYQIEKELTSYHKFNEIQTCLPVLEKLKAGLTISLISDAGTPCINDPGQHLVRLCKEQGIEVLAIPGPCSLIAALVSSGLDTSQFQFLGFAPKEAAKRKSFLENALSYPATSLFFETSHRLLKTLDLIGHLAPEREIALAKELTKRFETHWIGTSCSLLQTFQSIEPLGEWVVLLSGCTKPVISAELELALNEVKQLEAKGLSRRDSITAVSLLLHTPSQDLYRHLNA